MKLFKFDEKSLTFQKVNKLTYLLKYVGITLGLCLIFGIFTSLKYTEIEKIKFIESEMYINLVTNDSFTREKFYDEIDRSGFKFPEIIKAQALIESTHFSSPVWNENNNALGMRLPRSRFTLATGENLKHATFRNWKDCIKDRMIYEALYLHKLNKTQYYAYLDKVYARAGGAKYSDLIKQIIKQNNF